MLWIKLEERGIKCPLVFFFILFCFVFLHVELHSEMCCSLFRIRRFCGFIIFFEWDALK